MNALGARGMYEGSFRPVPFLVVVVVVGLARSRFFLGVPAFAVSLSPVVLKLIFSPPRRGAPACPPLPPHFPSPSPPSAAPSPPSSGSGSGLARIFTSPPSYNWKKPGGGGSKAGWVRGDVNVNAVAWESVLVGWVLVEEVGEKLFA